MELETLLRKRKSVRAFKNDPLPDEILLEVLEAGRIAPSAVNYQPWRFIVVDDSKVMSRIWEAYPRDWFKSAPCIIVVCGNHEESWKRKADNKDHCDIDAAIAIDHMTIMAAHKNLGTCWVCNFDPEKVIKVLDLPANIKPVALLPIGFPAEETEAEEKSRKPMENIAFRNNLKTPIL